MWILIVFAVFTYLVGLKIGKWQSRQKSSGHIRVDRSDPDGPYMFLELTEPVESFMSKKQVTLDVVLESYLTRE